jgi:hypothetical protein
MRTAWSLLDPDDLDSTFERWLTAALPIIQGQRGTSAQMAAKYLDQFKKLELGSAARLPLVLASHANVEAVTTSLLVTGPLSIKSAMARSAPLARAITTAQANTSAAAMRHVLNGGRDTTIFTVRDDPQAVGWARTTSGRACAFCITLASRGAVYREDSVDFEAHDHCSCGIEPMYSDRAALPPGSERAKALYDEAKAMGGDPVNNLRRLLAAE